MTTELDRRLGALDLFIGAPNPAFGWRFLSSVAWRGGEVHHLDLTSLAWQGSEWRHHLLLMMPREPAKADAALLFVFGDGGGGRAPPRELEEVAHASGLPVAALFSIPNQPLFGGRVEDALIAYSFTECIRTGDPNWPILFPMVKSVVAAMNALEEFSASRIGSRISRFIVTGASKRGWTSWLSGAVDPRIAGIAPMAFDMLHMKAQTEWQKRVYGRESDRIGDYSEAGLVDRIDDPEVRMLREWVDPFSYRERLTMPKLLLLGANDPYWTVDSVRHYLPHLEGATSLHITPNGGHGAGMGAAALGTLATWSRLVASNAAHPSVHWTCAEEGGTARFAVRSESEPSAIRFFEAESKSRDFRQARWSKGAEMSGRSRGADYAIRLRPSHYVAALAELEFPTEAGALVLTSAPKVVPDEE